MQCGLGDPSVPCGPGRLGVRFACCLLQWHGREGGWGGLAVHRHGILLRADQRPVVELDPPAAAGPGRAGGGNG